MAGAMDDASSILHSETASEMLVGFLTAGLLLLAASALLPPAKRGRARQGGVLLAMSLVLYLVRLIPLHETLHEAGAPRLLVFATSFTLLASIGRSLVVILIDVVVERRTARPSPRILP